MALIHYGIIPLLCLRFSISEDNLLSQKAVPFIDRLSNGNLTTASSHGKRGKERERNFVTRSFCAAEQARNF